MKNQQISLPEIVSRDEWLKGRKELLKKEKQLTKMRDAVSTERRPICPERLRRFGTHYLQCNPAYWCAEKAAASILPLKRKKW